MNILEPVLEAVGRILTDRHGIHIVCEGQRCATDGKTIHLPALPDDIPEDLWRAIRGFIDHEAGHIIYQSDFRTGRDFGRKHGADGFGLLNTLEDLRIERAMKQRFPGSAANLDHAYRAAEEGSAACVQGGGTLPFIKRLAFAAAATAPAMLPGLMIPKPLRSALRGMGRDRRRTATPRAAPASSAAWAGNWLRPSSGTPTPPAPTGSGRQNTTRRSSPKTSRARPTRTASRR